MKWIMLTAGTMLALATVSNAASARCVDDLKAARIAAGNVSTLNRKEAVKQKLDQADQALAKRDEHGCKAAVAEAEAMMK